QIAAVNSLSDVYAMGGRPLTALALVCFPEKDDMEILERILAGGLSKMMEAGCTIVGGHSIRDEEMKFGYSVTGLIHPQRVLANSGARAGDRLLLTKAIGTGVISTAIKKDKARPEWIEAAARSMTTLNKAAAEVITGCELRSPGQSRAAVPTQSLAGQPRYQVHGMTDITGFGLIGHARELALGSNVSLRLHASRVPLLAGAIECARAGYIPGGLKANREFAECAVEFATGISEEIKTLLFDPQTAGGLLVSVAAADAASLADALRNKGVTAAEIGEVIARTQPLISVQG
ncbi:MAG TPA: selenide, water dikinase SelD, partial [Terriglobales bacterium]|nr:selenide, water dikinase SelD [Terriglobales bacterium]